MKKIVLTYFTILCLVSSIFLVGFHVSVGGKPDCCCGPVHKGTTCLMDRAISTRSRSYKREPYASWWNFTTNPSAYTDIALGIAVDSEDNIVVVGYDLNTTGFGTQWRIMKFKSEGTSVWNYTKNISDTTDRASGVAVDFEDNIIAVGSDYNTTEGFSQWRIIKLDKNKNHLWNRTFDLGPSFDGAWDVAVDSDNNIIAVGYDCNTTDPMHDWQWRIMKFSSNGVSLWNYTRNMSEDLDRANGVAVDSDDNIVAVGFDSNTTDPMHDSQWRIMKFSSNSVSLWNYTTNPSDYSDGARDVIIDSEDNIIVAGYDRSTAEDDAQWRIMKFDSTGYVLWNYTTNISTKTDIANGVAVDSHDNIIIVGYDANTTDPSDRQWRIMKLSSYGSCLWNYRANISNKTDEAYAVAVDSQDDITAVGYDRNTTEGDQQWRIMKFLRMRGGLWCAHKGVHPCYD